MARTILTIQLKQARVFAVKDLTLGSVVVGSAMFARGSGLTQWDKAIARPKEQVDITRRYGAHTDITRRYGALVDITRRYGAHADLLNVIFYTNRILGWKFLHQKVRNFQHYQVCEKSA